MKKAAIVGAGLAGCECALCLANQGIEVTLYEQKPEKHSPAHVSLLFAELVCSNSLRSDELTSGIGLLKQEMRELQGALIAAADASRVPAGKALAVDRERFSRKVTDAVHQHPLIHVCCREIKRPDEPDLRASDAVVIAAGPLAGEDLSASLADIVGLEHLYFYDAIAPVVTGDSINMDIAFRGSRYEESGQGDYINCPMNEEEYHRFYQALLEGERVAGRDFEKQVHFEGCMPIEALAERGDRTLVFGSLKPVGFIDPRTGRRPYALVQLRPENLNETMFNLVGCQTKLTYRAQDAVFRLIPGLEHADFVRYGSMHRNTYVNAPLMLNENLSLKAMPGVYLAGQITGVEGYVESMACGLWLGLSLGASMRGTFLPAPPDTTSLGALLRHLRTPNKRFQPSNAHFGLMPEPDIRVHKKERKTFYAERARADFKQWIQNNRDILFSDSL
ncbi:MAG: methylenetetrahydrofolate--tRNA-(uracil(54)-C(5))-methyltransferase (FADH(2)-oxidizing) TrmFO [Desulfovibrionaceae bacterium]|nr:methylenetetrahydrofolate--tRNA-(uracil(54)-C(5))-methyltransferase (FADH(2)-oxidizing) TrmFO [Desulfovibrionaceae bacterium]